MSRGSRELLGIFTHLDALLQAIHQLRDAWKAAVDAKDLDGLMAYHIEGSKVTEISVQVSPEGRKRLELIIKVPGFSRYTLGGDNLWGAGDDPMPAPSVPGSP